jgi:hypothetical protein
MATLVSNDEVETRLSDPNNLLNRLKGEFQQASDYVETEEPVAEVNLLKLHNGGRNEGDGNIPAPVQAMIGVMAHLDTAKNVGEAFDVSRQQAHNLKHGRTTDKHGVNSRLVEDMNMKRMGIADRGLNQLIDVIKSFDVAEIKDHSKKIEAGVKLATIVEKMAPAEKESANKGNRIVVNIYAPRTKDIEDYDVLEIQAEEVE